MTMSEEASQSMADRGENRSRQPQSSAFRDFIGSGWGPRPSELPARERVADFVADRTLKAGAPFPGERLVVPGMSAARLRAMTTPHPDAVILRTFGVGNIPASEPGLVDVLTELAQAEVPIIVASQCYQSEVMLGHYEAGNALAQLGAIGAHDMTLEALYAKTVFLLSQGKRGADFKRWMDLSIAGELTLQD